MSLLRDPPTVLSNPLFIWSPSSPPFTLSDDSDVWLSGSGIIFLRLMSLMFCTLFYDAVVSRIHNCSILVLAYRRYLMLSQKFSKRILTSSHFFTKNFVVSQIFWDVPPLPGEFAFHFRNFDVCAFPPVSLGYSPT